MPKEEWGTKRLCPTTGKRFYDLGRDPIISPYTGETVTFDNNAKTRVAVPDKSEEKKKDAVDLVDDEDVVLDDDAEADVELEDDLLEDDDDEDSVSLEDIADVPADDDDT